MIEVKLRAPMSASSTLFRVEWRIPCFCLSWLLFVLLKGNHKDYYFGCFFKTKAQFELQKAVQRLLYQLMTTYLQSSPIPPFRHHPVSRRTPEQSGEGTARKIFHPIYDGDLGSCVV